MPSSPTAVAGTAPSLPVGQFLYAIHDTTLICVPLGGSVAQYQRVSFTGTAQKPQASVNDPIDLGAFDDIRSARAITNWSGKGEVVLLTKTGLSAIAMAGQTSNRTQVQAKVDDAALIIGLEPPPPPPKEPKRSLALLVSSGAGFAVTAVDMDSGVRGESRQLPSKVRGTAVAAELVRRGPFKTIEAEKEISHDPSTMLVIATVEEDNSLRVHAVAWESLASQTDETLVTTLDLGTALPSPRPQVEVAVTSMRAGAADQQLAVFSAHPNQATRIALVGWGKNGEPKGIAYVFPETGFARPEQPLYRLAAADLFHAGTDQLVLGYPATYGKVRGCAALMLFTLDESGAPAKLKCESKYAVANGGQAWANFDLRIGAGVFGPPPDGPMGLQVIGCGASLSDLFQKRVSVLCGFVPVDPVRRAFPEMTGESPGAVHVCAGPGGQGNALATVSPDGARILAFPSDLSGQSIVLGAPIFEQRSNCGQILAIIQAPPFDYRTKDNLPSISFSLSTGTASGVTVSSDKSWMVSDDMLTSLGVGPLSLSKSIHNSYLNSLGKVADSSESLTEQLSSHSSDKDYVLTYEMSYNIWRYPVVRASKNEAGEMLVIFPQAEPRIVPDTADTYAYRPRSQVGSLYSYVNVEKEGYKEDNRLFKGPEKGIGVSTGNNTASLSFDQSQSTSGTDSTHFTVTNTVSQHLSINLSTELFEYLPVNFGLSVGSSHSYSASEVKTTHLTVHSNLNVTVHSGTVKDELCKYRMFPYIYRHDRLGCLMVAWEVEITGEGWKLGNFAIQSLTRAQLILIRPATQSNNPLYAWFSRSISFQKKDGAIAISVEIFNNSPSPAQNVSCKFYKGKPVVDPESKSGDFLDPQPKENLLGEARADGDLSGLARRIVTLAGQNLPEPTVADPLYVTVQPILDGIPGAIYWGVHPPEAFFGAPVRTLLAKAGAAKLP